MTQNTDSRLTTSPTMLSGVEAPAVRAMVTRSVDGSQSLVLTSKGSGAAKSPPSFPDGRCLISSPETRHEASAMWKVRVTSSQILVRFFVLLLLYPPITIAEQSLDRILPILCRAADRFEGSIVFEQSLLTIAIDHGLSDHLADR